MFCEIVDPARVGNFSRRRGEGVGMGVDIITSILTTSYDQKVVRRECSEKMTRRQ